MLRLVTHGPIPKTVRKTLRGAKIIRCASSDGKDSMCADSTPKSNYPPVDPPPCPPPPPPCGPPCPPPICSIVPDPNNPCNYVPPANPDPDEPDMTRIKKMQCLYQQDDDLPVHLKGGKSKVYLFQFLTILGGISFLQSIFSITVALSK